MFLLSSCGRMRCPLNESPSEKEGKLSPSMKSRGAVIALNESPSEKEGKSCRGSGVLLPELRGPQ